MIFWSFDLIPEPTIYNMFKGFRAGKLNYDISLEEREERVKPLDIEMVHEKTWGKGFVSI